MSEKSTIHSLGLLRLIFILGIVLFHVHSVFGDPCVSVLGKAYKWGGGLGNIFFFVSSGLLISRAYYRRLAQSDGLTLPAFLGRRLVTIYPLFLITNVFMFAYEAMKTTPPTIDFSRLLMTLLFVGKGWVGNQEPYNFPTWFVCVLVLCYVLYYAIVRISKSRLSYRVLLFAGILLGYVGRIGTIDLPLLNSATGGGEMYFFIGCALNELLYDESRCSPLEKYIYIMLFGAFGFITVASCLFGFGNIASDTSLLLGAIVVPCVLIICFKVKWLNSFCDNRLFKHLSHLSTPLFYWHIPVLVSFNAIHRIVHPEVTGGIAMIAYFTLLILVCELSNAVFSRVEYRLRKDLLAGY